ncbi:MAG: hypothetical protein ACTSPM_12745, partial [Candidatus Heimdallarchaeota archaeon]
YPQRLEKVLRSSKEIMDYLTKEHEVIYRSTLDGQNLIVQDTNENNLVISIRPSGTGRYTKIITEIGLGKADNKERKEIAEIMNKNIAKIIGS